MQAATTLFYLTVVLAGAFIYGTYSYYNGEGKDNAYTKSKNRGDLKQTLESTLIDGIRRNTVDVELELLDKEIEIDGRRFKATIKTRQNAPTENPNVIVLADQDGVEG